MASSACTVDVWRLPLEGAPVDTAVLDDDERRRLGDFRSASAAHQFGATRTALRRLLAARLDVDAAALRIDTGPHGKPFLRAHAALRFSVSHSGALALVAMCDSSDIGIDLEHAGVFGDASRLWPLVCTDAEQRWLASHPVLAAAGFGRLWTRKEAVLKALGIGLAAGARDVDFSAQMQAGAGRVGVSPALAWQDLAPVDGAFGALAAVTPGAIDVRWHDAAG